MTRNSKAVAAQNIIFWQNRVWYKLKLNNNRCVNFSLSCVTTAKKSMCLQPWGELTKKLKEQIQKQKTGCGFWLYFVVLVWFFLSYTMSFICCLVPFSTEKAWEKVTHSLLGQTQQWCELAETSAEPPFTSMRKVEDNTGNAQPSPSRASAPAEPVLQQLTNLNPPNSLAASQATSSSSSPESTDAEMYREPGSLVDARPGDGKDRSKGLISRVSGTSIGREQPLLGQDRFHLRASSFNVPRQVASFSLLLINSHAQGFLLP